MAWVRAKLAKTGQELKQPWKETPRELGKRLAGIMTDINQNCDVDGLCREFPERLETLKKRKGGRLDKWRCSPAALEKNAQPCIAKSRNDRKGGYLQILWKCLRQGLFIDRLISRSRKYLAERRLRQTLPRHPIWKKGAQYNVRLTP